MKNKINTELILQIAILLVCGLILFITQSKVSVQAQTICTGPPLTKDIVPYEALATEYAWLKGTPVSVFIFNTEGIDFEKIDEGIRRWNPYKEINCSMVTFKNAEMANWVYEPYDMPDDGTMYVIREPNPGVLV